MKKKFLVRARKMSKAVEHSLGLKEFQVEQTFLGRGGSNEELGAEFRKVEESVRRRGRGGFYTFVHQVRRAPFNGEMGGEGASEEVVEIKRQITNREYLNLLGHADPTRRSVRIKRQCFLYQGRYFVLDTPLDVKPAVQLLRTHVENDVENVNVPDWIQVEREVTGQVEWTMHAMSMRVNPVRIMQNFGHQDGFFARNLMSHEMLFGTSV